MKIGYLVVGNPGATSGVWKKIRDQTECWAKLGSEPMLFCLARRGTDVGTVPGVEIKTEYYGGTFDRLPAVRNLVASVVRYRPDIVYHRYGLYYPSIVALARRIPMILEVNTFDLEEYRNKSWLQYHYNRLTRGALFSKVAGLVFIAEGLSRERAYTRFRKPCQVIGNGISLERFPVTSSPGNGQRRLIFIGQAIEPWHGVDKVLYLAERRPDWHFDLIGAKGQLGRPCPSNVTVHGHLQQEGYESLMLKADVAIGSLSLEKAGLLDGSPLKVREYLAYGIPTIIGYRDVDFPLGAPFLLQLPSGDDNIVQNLARIDSFVREMDGVRVPREAITHLDTISKEKARLAFLRKACVGT